MTVLTGMIEKASKEVMMDLNKAGAMDEFADVLAGVCKTSAYVGLINLTLWQYSENVDPSDLESLVSEAVFDPDNTLEKNQAIDLATHYLNAAGEKVLPIDGNDLATIGVELIICILFEPDEYGDRLLIRNIAS